MSGADGLDGPTCIVCKRHLLFSARQHGDGFCGVCRRNQPIPYGVVPGLALAAAPEVDAMAAQFVEPAVEAAREWRELERLLVQMTVAERREVLVFARARGAK